MSAASQMISCERVLELLLEYLEGDLKADLNDAMDRHFEACPECVKFTQQYKSTSKICREQLAREVPQQVREHVLAFLRKELKS